MTEQTVVAPPVVQALDFDRIFNAYMAVNLKVWAHNRDLTVGASEVFDCLRKVWFQKRGKEFGFEPDDVSEAWGATERGNIIENYFVVPGMKAGLPDTLTLNFAGSDQTTLILGKNSATPDGLITGLKPGPLLVKANGHEILIEDIQSDCIVLEIKSIDPRATLMEERAKHHGQSQVQLGLIRELTQWKPVYAVVLYIDASFLDKITPFVTEFTPTMYDSAKARADVIWQINNPMDIVAEGKFDNACEHCKWHTACTEAILSSIPKDAETTDAAIVASITPFVSDYQAKKAAFEKAELELAVLKDGLKAFLLDANVSKIQGNAWTVSWGPVKGKETVDFKLMEADGINIAQYKRRGAGHDQIRVTPRKEKSETVKQKRKKVS